MTSSAFPHLDVLIEIPKGGLRNGRVMPAHYGYLRGTVGADGEAIDCYIGEHPQASYVYVIDKGRPHDLQFDEHKVMLGFLSPKTARSVFIASYSDERGAERLRSLTTMSLETFRRWLKSGRTREPLAWWVFL